MITSQTLKEQIDNDIKSFGEYTYYDKGPREVTNLHAKTFKEMPIGDVAKILNELFRQGEPYIEFCLAVITELQDISDEQWEDLMDKLDDKLAKSW